MHIVHAAQVGQGGPVRIACMNLAKTDLGLSFDKLTAALQKCFDQHFLSIWGYPVTLYNTINPHPSDWQLVYFDNADAAGALGYHDITKDGQPVAKVFVETTIAAHELVSVTACHELFEMVIDPVANLWALGENGIEYAYEMSDPVEEDTFLVDGIEMSNFVHPAWFEPFKHPAGTKFDHLGLLKRPFSMKPSSRLLPSCQVQRFGARRRPLTRPPLYGEAGADFAADTHDGKCTKRTRPLYSVISVFRGEMSVPAFKPKH